MCYNKLVMKDLLAGLNPPQIEAVKAFKGPYLVIAGAGSGKTTALTRRIAYLIRERAVSPYHILAMTFTNKAAAEMRVRVDDLINTEYARPLIGTFHSVCVRILREDIHHLGYEKSFTILDQYDQLVLIKKIAKELELSKQQFAPRAMLEGVSRAKNNLLSPDVFSEQVGGYFEEQLARVYEMYQRTLRENHSVDFDDIIRLTIVLFKEHPDVLKKYQERFQYVLVDEYQDTNHAQYTFVKMITEVHRNIFVVGDDWQCLVPETKIRVSSRKNIAIKRVSQGDNVLSASGHAKITDQCVTEVKKHNFSGDIVVIETKSGKKLRVTPNHLMFAALSMQGDIFYVYLMYKNGVGYRIGIVKGVRIAKSGISSIGLNVRANQERADGMWILAVCSSRADAQYKEQLFSVRYGIPTLVFTTANRKMNITQKHIDQLFCEIDTEHNVQKIFRDFYLDVNYPHHVPQATIRGATKRLSITYTLFSDPAFSTMSPWARHRISISSTDISAQKVLHKNGFSTRHGKAHTWRYEKSTKSYEEAERVIERLKDILPKAHVRRYAIFGNRVRFALMPAGHIHPHMIIPVVKDGVVCEDEVVNVQYEQYAGPVYDLNVENTHNYIANDIVVHNSIYKWRGADVSNILNFEKDFPNAKVIKLEQNYRSTQNILDAAYHVIKHNAGRSDKKIWTDTGAGKNLISYEAHDEREEAMFIVQTIHELLEKGYAESDFVVLYRTNAQSRIVEEYFLKSSLSYRIVGGIRFYERKEVKDVMAYLKVIFNGADVLSLERAVASPRRGIGGKTFSGWCDAAREAGVDPITFGVSEHLAKSSIAKSKQKAIRDFCTLIDNARKYSKKNTLSDLILYVYEKSGYRNAMLDGTTEGEARDENVQELLSVATKYDDIDNALNMFIEEVSLASDTDHINQNANMVHLMTMHSAKGLEFPVVFIIGLEEGLVPHSRAMVSGVEMEEERRLAYVGITRAKDNVYLVHTRQRLLFGSLQANLPSRFLDDVPEQLVEKKETAAPRMQRTNFYEEKPESVLKAVGDDAEQFEDGDKVRHKSFGEGVVVGQTDAIIHVVFKGVGLKKLAKSIAPLEKL